MHTYATTSFYYFHSQKDQTKILWFTCYMSHSGKSWDFLEVFIFNAAIQFFLAYDHNPGCDFSAEHFFLLATLAVVMSHRVNSDIAPHFAAASVTRRRILGAKIDQCVFFRQHACCHVPAGPLKLDLWPPFSFLRQRFWKSFVKMVAVDTIP